VFTLSVNIVLHDLYSVGTAGRSLMANLVSQSTFPVITVVPDHSSSKRLSWPTSSNGGRALRPASSKSLLTFLARSLPRRNFARVSAGNGGSSWPFTIRKQS
jgi:hypothetical protein